MWPGMPKVFNNMYVVPLQYPKKESSYEVYVLHADKHESLLQVDSIIFNGCGQPCPNYPRKFAISSQYHLPFSSLIMESISSLFFI